jgi:hypothetical protein
VTREGRKQKPGRAPDPFGILTLTFP